MTKKRYKIDVTAGDIKMGRQRRAYECPVALAVRRATKARTEVMDASWIEVHHGMQSTLYTARGAIRVDRFIDRFDLSLPVKPFSFTLVEA